MFKRACPASQPRRLRSYRQSCSQAVHSGAMPPNFFVQKNLFQTFLSRKFFFFQTYFCPEKIVSNQKQKPSHLKMCFAPPNRRTWVQACIADEDKAVFRSKCALALKAPWKHELTDLRSANDRNRSQKSVGTYFPKMRKTRSEWQPMVWKSVEKHKQRTAPRKKRKKTTFSCSSLTKYEAGRQRK